MNKQKLKKIAPNFFAVIIFLILAAIYFYPQLKGYALRASDTSTFLGMSKEVFDYRETNNEEVLWTNSMFGGMPAYQISLVHKGNLLLEAEKLLIKKVLGHPISIFFLCMLGFYIMLLCFKVDPWLSIIGAIAFGFSTINILYLSAGHNTRVEAIALMPPVIGGIFYAYRKKLILGSALTAVFLSIHLSANHLQETYYLIFIILAIIIVEFYRHFLSKKLTKFVKTSMFLVIAAIIGVLPTFSNLLTTYEYSKYTTRSESELTIPLNEEEKDEATSGLDKWYIKQYNLGKGEVWSLVIPNVKGGKSDYLGNHKEVIRNNVEPQFREFVAQQSGYWGEQRFTGGAFYFGASVFLLFLLGLFFCKDPIKYAIIGVSILAIILSLKHSAILDFFIEHVPLFNKFRDSKIMLVLVQMAFPLMAVLFIKNVIKKEIPIKKTMYVFFGAVGVFIVIYATPSTWFDFFSSKETQYFNQQMASIKDPGQLMQFENYKGNIENARIAIFKSDILRSLLYILITGAILILFLKTKMKKNALIVLIGIVILIDLWGVNKRYLNNEKMRGQYVNWVEKYERKNPYRATPADKSILQMELKDNPELIERIQSETQMHFRNNDIKNKYKKNEQEKIAFRELNKSSDYRVLTLEDPFNSSAISYYHKSIGGYHGAKLRKYQELIEARIHKEINIIIDAIKEKSSDSMINAVFQDRIPTLNMLNTKYIVYNSKASPIVNNNRNGNAWFVQNYKIADNADQEIHSLNEIDPKETAVINKKFIDDENDLKMTSNYDTTAFIKLSSYKPNHLIYNYETQSKQLAVFSEIYYPKGWHAYIDNELTSHFRANYILRAMMLPKGKHKLEFKFEPKSYKIGKTISLAGSLLLILLLGGAIYYTNKQKKQSKPKDN